MRTEDAIKQSLIKKLPQGFALAKRGGIIDAFYQAFAHIFYDGEKAVEDLLIEINPRAANNLLEDFERVLGPDPCSRESDNQSIDNRQKRAWQRWIATGGQSIAYYLSLCNALGIDVEIVEFWPSVAGGLICGTPLIADGEQFVWLIKLQLINATYFITGANRAGDRLLDFEISDVECALKRLKPAHTHLVFSYS